MADQKKQEQTALNDLDDGGLSQASLQKLMKRIDEAIQQAQAKVHEFETALNDVNGILQRLHSTKSKIATLGIGADDVETIRSLTRKS